MKNTLTKYAAATGIATLALLVGDAAMAQDLKAVTNNLHGQLPGIADILSAVSYLAGIGFGIKAALKLKEHNDTKGQVPISAPITMAVVAALLIALPTLLTTSKGTIFGVGAQSSSLDSGSMRTLR